MLKRSPGPQNHVNTSHSSSSLINHPKMVPSGTHGSLAGSKQAGGHLQSHQVPPLRLVRVYELQLLHISSQQLPSNKGVKVAGEPAPKF